MVIDPSAILAIIYVEAEAEIFLHLISRSKTCLLSSPGYVELSIVLGTRHGEKGVENLDLLGASHFGTGEALLILNMSFDVTISRQSCECPYSYICKYEMHPSQIFWYKFSRCTPRE